MKKILIIIGSCLVACSIIVSVVLICKGRKNNDDVETRIAQIVKIEGTVSVNEKAAYKNEKLAANDIITSSKNSVCYIQIDNDKVVKILESSIVSIKELKNNTLAIHLEEGSLYFNVENKLASDESMYFETENTTMSIRGTTGYISALNDEVEVIIPEGTVTGTIDGKSFDATSGVKFVIDEENKIVNNISIGLNDLPEVIKEEIVKNESLVEKVAKGFENAGIGEEATNIDIILGKEHEHTFINTYFYDFESHFNICACGERTNVEEHKFGEVVVKIEPTDEADGIGYVTCEVCKFTKYVPITKPAKEHVHTFERTYDDEKHYDKCSECGLIIEEEHSVDKEETTKEANCVEKGTITYTCSCGYSWDEEIPTLDTHNLGEATVLVEATCNYHGYMEQVCEDCKKSFISEIEPFSHKLNQERAEIWEGEDESQVFMQGMCLYCGQNVTITINKNEEHEHFSWGYETDGEIYYKVCAICGEKYDYCTEHNFVFSGLDCYEDTVTTYYYCTNCGMSTYEENQSDHVHTVGTELDIYHNEETSTEYHFIKCSKCGLAMRAEPHQFDLTVIPSKEIGSKDIYEYHCSLCGYSFTEKEDQTLNILLVGPNGEDYSNILSATFIKEGVNAGETEDELYTYKIQSMPYDKLDTYLYASLPEEYMFLGWMVLANSDVSMDNVLYLEDYLNGYYDLEYLSEYGIYYENNYQLIDITPSTNQSIGYYNQLYFVPLITKPARIRLVAASDKVTFTTFVDSNILYMYDNAEDVIERNYREKPVNEINYYSGINQIIDVYAEGEGKIVYTFQYDALLNHPEIERQQIVNSVDVYEKIKEFMYTYQGDITIFVDTIIE